MNKITEIKSKYGLLIEKGIDVKLYLNWIWSSDQLSEEKETER